MFARLPAIRVCTLLLALGFPAASVNPAHAQSINTVRFSPPSGRPGSQLLPAPGGGWLLAGQVQWNVDSSTLNLIRLNSSLVSTRTRQYKTSGSFSNYSSFAAISDGWLVGGNPINGPAAFEQFIFNLDTTLAPRWGERFTNLQGDRLPVILAEANGIVTGYTGSSNISSRFSRIWGQAATGTGWRGQSIVSSTLGFRVESALAHGPAGTHYLTGTRGGGTGAPLLKLDTTRVYWAVQISAGGVDESTAGARPAPNGDLWLTLSTQVQLGIPDEVVLCRFDTAGTLLSSRRITMANRYLTLTSVVELPSGDVLLAGSSRAGAGGTQHPTLVRLNAAGGLEWARRWNTGSGSFGGHATLVPRPGGGWLLSISQLTVAELDANGYACQFLNEPAGSVTVGPAAMTVTPIPLTVSAFVPTHEPETLRPRTMLFQRTQICTAVGLSEAAAQAPLEAWPQPAPRGTAWHVRLPEDWPAGPTRATLTSVHGAVVWQGQLSESLTVPNHLPAGCWLLTLHAANHTAQRLLMSE